MKTNTISCAQTPGTTLYIKHANYGRTSTDVCKHPYGIERLHNDTNCRDNNSLSIVRNLCEKRVSCTITADASLFGDPCYGIYKYLEADFECQVSGLWIIPQKSISTTKSAKQRCSRRTSLSPDSSFLSFSLFFSKVYNLLQLILIW